MIFSGITFIRYTPHKVKRLESHIIFKSLWEQGNQMGLNRIAKISYGYLCLRVIDLCFNKLHISLVSNKIVNKTAPEKKVNIEQLL